MRQSSRDRRRRQLWAVAKNQGGILTLRQAAADFDVGIIATRAILKELMVAGANIPAITGYKPNFGCIKRALQYGERHSGPAYPIPTDPRQECEEGEGLKVESKMVEAEIWPPRAMLPKTAKFYRLR